MRCRGEEYRFRRESGPRSIGEAECAPVDYYTILAAGDAGPRSNPEDTS